MRPCSDSMAAAVAAARVGICEDGTGVVVGANAITDTLAVKRSDTVTIPLAARGVRRYGRSALKGYGRSGDVGEDRISELPLNPLSIGTGVLETVVLQKGRRGY